MLAAMFGKGMGWMRVEFQAGQVVTDCDHLGLSHRGQLEHEIFWKAFAVPF
ncbi:MAG: hypothetical protein QG656_643, partial [Candidatus Hydrogenedentes bacterium]|nr:hypothetical protein [Candidatus Hydrogenedentota bacterium]